MEMGVVVHKSIEKDGNLVWSFLWEMVCSRLCMYFCELSALGEDIILLKMLLHHKAHTLTPHMWGDSKI